MESTRQDAEVVVVGGGPAGATTAFWLARAGLRVTLVDRARFPRTKPCAEYLSRQSSRILDAMGILEAVERTGAAQLTGMRIRSADGTTFAGRFLADHGYRGFRPAGPLCCSPVAATQSNETGPQRRAGYSFTKYSLWTSPLGYSRVATCVTTTSRDSAPNSGMPAPINTGTRVTTSRWMSPASRNR